MSCHILPPHWHSSQLSHFNHYKPSTSSSFLLNSINQLFSFSCIGMCFLNIHCLRVHVYLSQFLSYPIVWLFSALFNIQQIIINQISHSVHSSVVLGRHHKTRVRYVEKLKLVCRSNGVPLYFKISTKLPVTSNGRF